MNIAVHSLGIIKINFKDNSVTIGSITNNLNIVKKKKIYSFSKKFIRQEIFKTAPKS